MAASTDVGTGVAAPKKTKQESKCRRCGGEARTRLVMDGCECVYCPPCLTPLLRESARCPTPGCGEVATTVNTVAIMKRKGKPDFRGRMRPPKAVTSHKCGVGLHHHFVKAGELWRCIACLVAVVEDQEGVVECDACHCRVHKACVWPLEDALFDGSNVTRRRRSCKKRRDERTSFLCSDCRRGDWLVPIGEDDEEDDEEEEEEAATVTRSRAQRKKEADARATEVRGVAGDTCSLCASSLDGVLYSFCTHRGCDAKSCLTASCTHTCENCYGRFCGTHLVGGRHCLRCDAEFAATHSFLRRMASGHRGLSSSSSSSGDDSDCIPTNPRRRRTSKRKRRRLVSKSDKKRFAAVARHLCTICRKAETLVPICRNRFCQTWACAACIGDQRCSTCLRPVCPSCFLNPDCFDCVTQQCGAGSPSPSPSGAQAGAGAKARTQAGAKGTR